MHTRQTLPSADLIAKLPPDGGPEFNRLVFSSSPYLRQHARNPVEWHEWGEEAFALARRENKPIFLSVGYSACHWCHVMEHESFEDAKVAELMNKLFVNVKVDREERPDVDQIYMNATQALTGRGGWPNSVFLDHDKRPFFAGTYFPKEDRGPQPGFVSVLYRIAEVWREDKPLIERTAAQVAEEVARLSTMTAAVARVTLDTNVLTRALAAHREEFDAVHGGFGGAPKFPPHTTLGLLLALQEAGREPALDDLITTTLDAMARGGIHDHVGGGFHRYATDAVWFLPHFEKMLYDNAQLARVYARAEALYPGRGYGGVACDTIDWCLRELRHAKGGFFSAYDADSEGEEGKYYLWRLAEVKEVLGEEKGAAFAAAYQITAAGNYYEEATGTRTPDNIPHLRGPTPEGQVDALRLLREARAKRVKPGLDDKVLLGWNGLMVGALATAGQVLNRPDYVAEAKTTAAFLLQHLRKDGQWQRSWREGDARIPAYLDDLACLAAGLLDLHEATGEKAWLDEAVAVLAAAEARFADKAGGGYYLSGDHHEAMIARGKEPFDNATPAPNGILAQAFARLERLTTDPGWTRKADAQLSTFSGLMSRVPTAMSTYLEAALLRPAGELNPATVRAPRVALAAQLVGQGESASARLHLRVEPGWHINANPASQPHLIPLRVRVAGRDDTPAVAYPAGKPLAMGEGDARETLSVHEGLVSVTVPLGKTGADALELEVEFQACDDRACDLPRTVRVPVLRREGARAP